MILQLRYAKNAGRLMMSSREFRRRVRRLGGDRSSTCGRSRRAASRFIERGPPWIGSQHNVQKRLRERGSAIHQDELNVRPPYATQHSVRRRRSWTGPEVAAAVKPHCLA